MKCKIARSQTKLVVVVSSVFCCFKGCFTITVIPVKRWSQGCCTLRFRPLSMRRWFAHRQSSWSAFFSVIFYDLRSLHSGTCLNTKTPRAFRWKRAFSTWISLFASFWLCFEQANWTGSRKKLGYEVNFLSLPRVVRSSNIPKLLPRPCPVCLFKA